jgi:hypothetical protein
MPETTNLDNDVALSALNSLSQVTESSISGLADVNSQLAQVRRQRRRGWSWRRIVADPAIPNPLSAATSIAADLAVATGEFRRALAHALRNEGLALAKIGPLLSVSRQRVGALLHRGRQTSGHDIE